MTRVVRLPAAECDALAEALGTTDLDVLVRAVIESVLTTYHCAVGRAVPAARMRRSRLQHQTMIKAARTLLARIEHTSVEDAMDAHKRGTETSALQDALAERVAQWERAWTTPRRASRPVDWHRRILIYRLLGALDDLGVKRSYYRDGPRILALQRVLRIADRIDGKKRPQQGSLRIIKAVYRDYRESKTWSLDSPRHGLYEHHVDWPAFCLRAKCPYLS